MERLGVQFICRARLKKMHNRNRFIKKTAFCRSVLSLFASFLLSLRAYSQTLYQLSYSGLMLICNRMGELYHETCY